MNFGVTLGYFGFEGTIFIAGSIIIGLKNLEKDKYIKVSLLLTLTLISLILASVVLIGRVTSDKYQYLSDYTYPEYLRVSSSSNIVLIHERLDLRPRRKSVLFKDGRVMSLGEEELDEFLQIQETEVNNYLTEINSR
jgi:hypothetical protein